MGSSSPSVNGPGGVVVEVYVCAQGVPEAEVVLVDSGPTGGSPQAQSRREKSNENESRRSRCMAVHLNIA